MNKASQSLNQRIKLIASLLKEKQNPNFEISTTDNEWIERLCELYQKSKLEEPTKIVLIYLGFVARYPSQEEIKDFEFFIQRKTLSTILFEITQKAEFQNLIASETNYLLKLSEPTCLYIDVTHTMSYPSNTGIQRVVRSLCTSYKNHNFNIQLFKIENRPILLSGEEEDHFYSWNKFIQTKDSKLAEISEDFLSQAKKLINITKNIVRAIESEYPWIRSFRWKAQKLFRNKNKVSKRRINEVPIFINQNQQILLPELCFESSRIQFYNSLGLALPQVYINVIIYDLIPVYFPQYVVASLIPSFIEYLTILRHAKKISCISKHVQNELTSFLTPFENKPLISHHLLGSNAEIHAETTEQGQKQNSASKKILCVGTIEPRKNQSGILRAAQILWDQGHEFELQFVGAMGWKNETFLEELEQAKRKYKVIYLKHVKEEVLQKLYEEAHFTVFASFVEGFGLPIIESLRHGKPCISSNTSSMKEIVEKTGACITIDPNSVMQIAEAMKELLTNDSKYQELKKQARSLNWQTWDDYSQSIYDFVSSPENRSEVESEKSSTSIV